MTAGSLWARQRDLPDPSGWDDFAAFPEIFFEQLRGRIAAGRFPLSGERFTLPKTGLVDGLRLLTWLDPYDEAALRVIVGRLLPSVERAKGGEVYSYSLAAPPPAWWTRKYGVAIGARRDRALALLKAPGCQGLGTFDVRDYFRSVDIDVLASLLKTLGCPIGAVTTTTAVLVRLKELGAPGGLPIGFEGSGYLGNAALFPLDEMLRSRVPFVRYTDDVWTFPAKTDDWETLVGDVAAKLVELKLDLNDDKTWLWDEPWDEPEGIIRNRTLDSVTAAAGPEEVSADTALDLLRGEATAEYSDWAVVRFALGVLGRAHDARGVGIIEEAPLLFTEEPVKVGRYLTSIASHPPTSHFLDHDWVLERAQSGDARALAARMYACVVASNLHNNEERGSRYFDLATAMEHQRRAPLQVWAAAAWSGSEHWKPSRAVDAAEHFGSLQLRRSFCLSFKRRGAGKKASLWKQHLALKEPDLRPTLEYSLG